VTFEQYVGPERFEPTIPTNRGIYIRLSSSSFVRTTRSRLVGLEPFGVLVPIDHNLDRVGSNNNRCSTFEESGPKR